MVSKIIWSDCSATSVTEAACLGKNAQDASMRDGVLSCLQIFEVF